MPYAKPPEKADQEIHAHMNLMLRQVQPDIAEEIINEMNNSVFRPRVVTHDDREADIVKVRWQTALAAIAAVAAAVIMQCPGNRRLLQASVFGRLLAENLKNGALHEAVTRASGEAATADVVESQGEVKH